MSQLLSGVARFRSSKVIIGLVFLATVLPAFVQASVIKTMETKTESTDHDGDEKVRHKHQLNPSELRDLETFLAGGPRLWINVKPPKFPAGLSITKADGTLKSNNLVTYLEWRRNQDPTFFDSRHPDIAPLLAHAPAQTAAAAQMLQSPATNVTTKILTASRASSAIPALAAETLAVPEPSSVAITMVLFGSAAWWRLRAGRKATATS